MLPSIPYETNMMRGRVEREEGDILNSWISKNIFRSAVCQAFVFNNGWHSFLHYNRSDDVLAVV